MIWQTVLDVIDAIESWIAGQSYWIQVVVLLAVLGPLCYLLAGLIDRVVEAVLAWHGRRDQPAAGVAAPGVSAAGMSTAVVSTAPVSAAGMSTAMVSTAPVSAAGVSTDPTVSDLAAQDDR